jgi:hypothetical protein
LWNKPPERREAAEAEVHPVAAEVAVAVKVHRAKKGAKEVDY